MRFLKEKSLEKRIQIRVKKTCSLLFFSLICGRDCKSPDRKLASSFREEKSLLLFFYLPFTF